MNLHSLNLFWLEFAICIQQITLDLAHYGTILFDYECGELNGFSAWLTVRKIGGINCLFVSKSVIFYSSSLCFFSASFGMIVVIFGLYIRDYGMETY